MTMQATRPQPSPPAPTKARPHWALDHIPALDGLRGAAVLAVVLYHGHYLKGGYLGVDLFFVLSGFLITSLILIEHRSTGKINLTNFWTRRARRLLPAVLVLMGGIAIYCHFWASPIDLGTIRGDGVATLLYVANWHTIWNGTSYWDISRNTSPLTHTWSLAVEEQFYLFWPLILTVVLRRGGRQRPRRVFRFCMVMAVLSVALFIGLHASGASFNRVYEGTDTRLAAIAFGAALAAWIQWRGKIADQKRPELFEAAGVAAAILLGTAWLSLDIQSTWLTWGMLPVCSLLAVIALAAATNPQSPYLGKVFSLPPLRWLGLISYGLYLWHFPVFLVLNENRTGLHGVALLIVQMATALAISILSYVLIEQPIRHGALRGTKGKISIPVALVAGFTAIFIATSGAIAPSAVNRTAASEHAATTIAGAPRFMIVGDSVANSLAGPLIDDPRSFGVNPTNESVIGCQLLWQGHRVQQASGISSPKACLPDLTQVTAKNRPNVVMVLFDTAATNALEVDGSFRYSCDTGFGAELNTVYRQAYRQLSSGGAQVMVATVPLSNNPFSEPSVNQRITCFNAALADSVKGQSHVQLLDLNGHVCPGGNCIDKVDGKQLRPDSVHFDGPGGVAVSHWVVTQSLKQAGLKAASLNRPGAPAYCADLRSAVRPVTNLLTGPLQTSGPARRSAAERLSHTDLATIAARLPASQRADLTAVDAAKGQLLGALKSLADHKPLTPELLPATTVGPLDRLDAYLKAHCD